MNIFRRFVKANDEDAVLLNVQEHQGRVREQGEVAAAADFNAST